MKDTGSRISGINCRKAVKKCTKFKLKTSISKDINIKA